MSRPRLLDLYCGAGGCAVGYHRAGFDVVGVDIRDQPNYPFEFHQADALTYPLDGFEAIHASPPCQGYVNQHFRTTPSGHVRKDHPMLIDEMRERLEQAGVPWIIENVAGAKPFMRSPVMLCGSSFDLPLRRHRLFESNVTLLVPSCDHSRHREAKYPTQFRPKNGQNPLSRVVQVYGNGKGSDLWANAMGIDWMSRKEITQAIPPAYTELIGHQLMQHVKARAA